MKLTDAVMLMERYRNCLKCSNQFIGDGEGQMITEETTFYRSCKCGWNVKVTIEEGADNAEQQ